MCMNNQPIPRQTTWGYCFETCAEVQREALQADRMRALIARLIDFLPANAALTAEAQRVLE